MGRGVRRIPVDDDRDAREAGSRLVGLDRPAPGVRCGVVVLGPKGRGPFAPVAVWPAGTSGSRPLAEVVEKAITDRKSLSNYFTIGRDGWTRLPLLATTPDLFVFNPPIIRHAVMRDLPTLGPPLITRD